MPKFLNALAAVFAATLLSSSMPAAAAKYDLRLATVVKAPHPWLVGAEFMAEEMRKRTNGEVEIKIFDGGSLGNDKTAIDQMRLGAIDFVVGGTTNAASFLREFQVFSIDYLFRDMAHFRKATAPDSPLVSNIQSTVDSRDLGFKVLALCGGGTRNVSNSLRPIRTPDDLKGIKMRVPGSKVEVKVWSALGAVPTSLPWTELYSATQTGVVNAFESTISGYKGSKLYEVAPYHSKTGHQIMMSHISMSTQSFNKLPPEYRKAIVEVAAQAGRLVTDSGERFDAEFLGELTKLGAKVNDVDTQAFVNRLLPLHDELAAEAKVTHLLEMIRAIK